MTFVFIAPILMHPVWLASCPKKVVWVVGKIKAMVGKAMLISATPKLNNE